MCSFRGDFSRSGSDPKIASSILAPTVCFLALLFFSFFFFSFVLVAQTGWQTRHGRNEYDTNYVHI